VVGVHHDVLGFYPDTTDRQKIAWVGTLLTDTALVWHLHRYRELQDNDNWANYSAAIRTEYRNEREVADAQLKLGQLRYQGSIRAYLTEFWAFNNFARATGEALWEKVDLAMLDAVLDMCFAHYQEDFADDEGFLQATHQACLQVEKKKALRLAREQARTPAPAAKRDEKNRDREGLNNSRKEKETMKEPLRETRRDSEYGGSGKLASEAAAFKGVADHERRKYTSTRGCHRYGRPSHRAAKYFASTTAKGTDLPPLPWKIAAGTKRPHEPEEEALPALKPKAQKMAALDVMDSEPLWAEEEDF